MFFVSQRSSKVTVEIAHIDSVFSPRPDRQLAQQAPTEEDQPARTFMSAVVSALAVSLRQRFVLRSSTPIELVTSPEFTIGGAAKPNSLGRGFLAPPSAVTFRTSQAQMNRSTMLDDPLSKVHAS